MRFVVSRLQLALTLALGLSALTASAQSVITGAFSVIKAANETSDQFDDQFFMSFAVASPASYGLETIGRNYACERNACSFVINTDGSLSRYVVFDIGRPASEAYPTYRLRSVLVPVVEAAQFVVRKFDDPTKLTINSLLLSSGHRVLTIEQVFQGMSHFVRGKPTYNLKKVDREEYTEANFFNYEASKLSLFLQNKKALSGQLTAAANSGRQSLSAKNGSKGDIDYPVIDIRRGNVSCWSALKRCTVRINHR